MDPTQPWRTRNPGEGGLLLLARALLDDHIRPRFEGTDPPNVMVLRRLAARRGLTGIDLNRPYGAGPELAVQGALHEACGTVDIDAREVIGCGHAKLIDDFGSPRLHQRWLTPVCDRGALIGVAVTEPGAGSDLRALTCSARQTRDGYVLNGTKGPMSRVREAAAFVVFAREANGPAAGRVSAFVVDARSDGVDRSTLRPMGLRGFSFGRIHLSNVEVDLEDRLGDGGDGDNIFNRHFARWRTFMGLLGLGAAQRSLDETFDHVREREVYGRRISEIPQVAHHLAHHLTQVSAARALSYWALERLEQDPEAYEATAMSKVASTMAAYRAIDYCVQLHGAKGYTSSLRLEKRLRDIRGLMIADGPNDVLTASIARSRLGSPLEATDSAPADDTTARSA